QPSMRRHAGAFRDPIARMSSRQRKRPARWCRAQSPARGKPEPLKRKAASVLRRADVRGRARTQTLRRARFAPVISRPTRPARLRQHVSADANWLCVSTAPFAAVHVHLCDPARTRTHLFLPESRKPLAKGFRSIFSLVICRGKTPTGQRGSQAQAARREARGASADGTCWFW
uniref:Uncharacterized protein n=1 Tax=Hippocampus comes TaxID=109280 RepID=A0A3Q2YM89_HIPCM